MVARHVRFGLPVFVLVLTLVLAQSQLLADDLDLHWATSEE